MSTSLINMDRKAATIETEKGLHANSNSELLATARQKRAEVTHTKGNFLEIIPPMYE